MSPNRVFAARTLLALILAPTLSLSFALSASAAAPLYHFTDLGTFATTGQKYSVAYDVNNEGQVVGYSRVDSGQRAFLWTNSTGMQDLGELSGGVNLSHANAINNSGQVVGESAASDGTHAFLWTAGGGMQDLGPVSSVAGLNDAGQFVGATREHHAYIWQIGGSMQDFADLPGNWSFSSGVAVNSAGQVVGSRNPVALPHAFIWSSDAGVQDLGDLPGGLDESIATDVNSSGQVVGWSYAAPNDVHAFLWTSTAGMQDLGALPLNSNSQAFGINASGQVVGSSSPSALGPRYGAFLWSADNGMQNLNDLVDGSAAGFFLQTAMAISDNGYIVGIDNPLSGTTGEAHAFLLTPLPEPSTLALAAAGLAIFLLPYLQRRGTITSLVCGSSRHSEQ